MPFKTKILPDAQNRVLENVHTRLSPNAAPDLRRHELGGGDAGVLPREFRLSLHVLQSGGPGYPALRFTGGISYRCFKGWQEYF